MQGVGAQHHCATEARHEMLQVATYANCLLAVAYVQSGREDERWRWRSLLLYAAWHVWVEGGRRGGCIGGCGQQQRAIQRIIFIVCRRAETATTTMWKRNGQLTTTSIENRKQMLKGIKNHEKGEAIAAVACQGEGGGVERRTQLRFVLCFCIFAPKIEKMQLKNSTRNAH